MDGPCPPGLAAWSPHPSRLSHGDCARAEGGLAGWKRAGCSRVPVGTLHRSQHPPGHGPGGPGFGGVRPHGHPAGEAAVPEPPSVHGNHGPCQAPAHAPWLTGCRGVWAFRVPPRTCVSPEPTGSFLCLSPFPLPSSPRPLACTHCPPPSCRPFLGPPFPLGLTFGPTSMWHSPCGSGLDPRKLWGSCRHFLLLAGR